MTWKGQVLLIEAGKEVTEPTSTGKALESLFPGGLGMMRNLTRNVR